MVKHKKVDAFFKRKVSDKDANCIASTSTLERKGILSVIKRFNLMTNLARFEKVAMDNFDINCLPLFYVDL